MADGYKTGGRKKGTPNKINANARTAVAIAAEKLGGVDRLVAWAKEAPENERAFWVQVYPKLVPLQNEITGADGGPLQQSLTVEFVKANVEREVSGEA